VNGRLAPARTPSGWIDWPSMHPTNNPAAALPQPVPAHRRLGDVLWRNLRVGVPVCTAVALLISLIFRDRLVQNLVFSLCIGLSIQALVQVGRYVGTARQRGRGERGLELDHLWPGWRWMGPWVVGAAMVGYAVGATLASALLGLGTPLHMLANPRALVIVLAITLLASGLTTYFYVTRGRLDAAEAAAQAARRAAAEHQLMLLQSQLEPHMLFNTLANLRVLIASDPARAQAMLDRLIAFLRATLNASRSSLHPLQAEFDRVGDYLALMAVRMGPRLVVQLDLPEALRQVPVPPLLLQPLVENSIKHGLEPQVAGGRIDVSARREGSTLVLSVRDTGAGLAASSAPPASGFGTAQVQERLATLYGDRARFHLRPAPEGERGALAELRLPLDAG
jgi:signal transduction histidine kinase